MQKCLRLMIGLGLLATVPLVGAAERVHLLGFVERLCEAEPRCFELAVESSYVAQAGARVTVRFDASTEIFDPENYRLPVDNSRLVPGAHLRLMLLSDDGRAAGGYRAQTIWIGD